MTHLTERQYEVWRYAALGLSNKEIAGRLNVSVKTVEKHRDAVRLFLGIHSVADLTRRAVQHGVIAITLQPLLVSRTTKCLRYVLPPVVSPNNS